MAPANLHSLRLSCAILASYESELKDDFVEASDVDFVDAAAVETLPVAEAAKSLALITVSYRGKKKNKEK